MLDAKLHNVDDTTRVATCSEESVSKVRGMIPSKLSDRNSITAIQRIMS